MHVTHTIVNTHKHHTITFYKCIWVYCIFAFYIPKNEGDMCTVSWMFLSFLWHLPVIMFLFNSPSYIFRLEHHGVWIRDPPFLQVSKELLLTNYFQKIYTHLCVTLPPVPLPVPTTSRIDYILVSPPPPFKYHIWVSSKCEPQWWPYIAEYTH